MKPENSDTEGIKLRPVSGSQNKYNDSERGATGSPSSNEDYDPHLHRQIEHPTT